MTPRSRAKAIKAAHKAELEGALSKAVNEMVNADSDDAVLFMATHLAALRGLKLVPIDTSVGAAPQVADKWQRLTPKSEEARTHGIAAHAHHCPTSYAHRSQELAAILEESGIDLRRWGIGKAKSPSHLFEEVKKKKCSLERTANGALRRMTVVIGCKLMHADELLIASREVFQDRTVEKLALPNGKVNAGVDWRDIARSTLTSALQLDAGT